jgi:hypothetical protein
MRIGKHEMNVLLTLLQYDDIARLPIGIIKRECRIKDSSILSRTIKTLYEKGLIWCYGVKYKKYIALTSEGDYIAKIEQSKS